MFTERERCNITVQESLCAWIDLLGYGKAFYESDWNLYDERAVNNLYRIQALQDFVLQINNPFCETIFTLNDGVIYNFDFSSSATSLMNWLIDIILKFDRIDSFDKANGYYGARGVVAYGHRARYNAYDSQGRGEFIATSEEKKKEYNKKTIVYSPNELQMNTAFSKANIIEEGGSSKGLKHNKLHFDENVLRVLAEKINEIGSQEFLRVDGLDPIVYRYKAEFCESKRRFIVKAYCDDISWDCLVVEFEKPIAYDEPKRNIKTNLYIPVKIKEALYSPEEPAIQKI